MITTRKANTTNANTTNKARTLTLAVVAAVAVFASACGTNGAPEVAAEAPTETVLISAPPTSTTEGATADDTEPVANTPDDDGEAAPEVDTDVTPAAAPTPTPAAECTSAQHPSLPFASVVNIKSNDADAGLNVRNMPGTSGAKIGTLSSGEVVETSFHADVKCATDSKGGVWWYVYGSDVQGWAHTGYLAEQADDFPIAAPAPEATPTPEPAPEEADVTFDCATIPGATNCVAVVHQVDGSIIVEVTPDTDTIIWAQTACIYGGHQMSCDILAAIGQSDPGNGFFQAPTEALVADCAAGDPATESLVAMACAELATRS